MLLSVSLLAMAAGCSPSTSADALPPGAAQDPVVPVVQAFCPPIVMREETAVHRAYTRGGQDNPEKLMYQASLADMTRQCTANETTITINVMAQGRIVAGPAATDRKSTRLNSNH